MDALRAFLIAVSLTAGTATAAELIVNGGFEQPVIASGAYTIPGGEFPSIPGWTISVDVRLAAPDAWLAIEGRQSLDLVGGQQAGGYIEQTVTTIPGQKYDLRFSYANNPSQPAVGSFRLVGSGTLIQQTLTHSGSVQGAMNFTLFETNFTADSSQTTLRFTRLSSTYGESLVFDAVSVTPAFCSPHSAEAVPVLVNGFVVGATITDAGCGYTNPPIVLIQGGGGSGATATAVISNGIVVGINITGAGCCYTTNSPPEIVIASPPFAPTLSISVSKVKVTQKVVLGRNYILEASKDLKSWEATGPQFTAQSETIVSEFDVDLTGRFFRIREVP